MASRRPQRRIAQLWQLPLLVVSVALFAYAAYRFIDPKPVLTIDQKIAAGRTFLAQDRPKAAIEHLGGLLNTEKLDKAHEGQIHILLAEALELGQKQLKIRIPRNYQSIIEQTDAALAGAVAPTYDIHRRLAESYEALHRPTQAIEHYRLAQAFEPTKSLSIQRKIIDLQLVGEDPAKAAESLKAYLSQAGLAGGERAWALGEQSHLLIDMGRFEDARKVLAQAVVIATEPVDKGQINYWLGYCAWKLGDPQEADRLIRVARDQFRTRHPLDGDACYALARIAQEKGNFTEAASFYDVVLQNHPESRVAPLSRLGRGVCRAVLGQDDPGLTDLHDVVNQITDRGGAYARMKDDAVAGLKLSADALAKRGNYLGALELMTYEQDLNPEPGAAFFSRLASVYERRADEIEQAAATAKPAEKVKREELARDLRTKAGDAYVANSRALTLADDKGYADALWRGIDLYDRCGDLRRAIGALKLFVAENPSSSLTPDALLRLGRAYQAAGMFDEAIAAYQRNQFRYSKSLAASRSAIPLAQAYVAKGPDFYAKAETVLLNVVENNPLVSPEAQEFRESLFELAQLYYRTNRFEESIARLEELTDRYPAEERMGQLTFLMGDSYRKSAWLLSTNAAAAPDSLASGAPLRSSAATRPSTASVLDPGEVLAARKLRLEKARGLFDKVVDIYKINPPKGEIDKLYQRLSHFYRADCVYDLGNYAESIRLYDLAAFRYQDDPSALAAYIQIVNAYCALGKVEEAKTANERAKWLLRKMPPENFADGGFNMPKAYWEKWLQWSSSAGLWQ